jgi:multidrug efflux system membrane fusion protein
MRRLMGALCLCLIVGCQKQAPVRPPIQFPVETELAVSEEVPIFIEALGHIEPMVSVDIRSRIEGELTGIFFSQGQEVKKGDLLFTIDPRPYQAALKEAQGALDQSVANLSLAQEKVKRYRMLAAEEYYAQIDYEALQADLASAQAEVEKNRGSVDRALINLNYCWIYAPIDGLMSILQIDYGNLIKPEADVPLATLKQIAPIYVTYSIPEHLLHQVQKHRQHHKLKVAAAFEEFGPEQQEGELEIVDNAVDPNTGMIKLRALFPNEKRTLWPGQFVRTRTFLYTMEQAVVIPFTAIQFSQQGPLVFVLKGDHTVGQRSVTLGQRMGDRVIVLTGVEAGETIITKGQVNLSEGALVAVRKRS